MSKLEDFIKKNRNEFESKLNSDLHFENFKHKLNSKNKTFKLMTVFKYAAILIFFLGFNFYFLQSDNAKFSKADKNLSFVPETYTETEFFYTKKINKKIIELNNLNCTNSNSQKEKVLFDIKELEKSEKEIRNDLKFNPHDSRIINALITNQETKINILDIAINELKRDC